MPLELDISYSFQRLLEKSRTVSGRLVSRQLTFIIDSFLRNRYEKVSGILKKGEEIAIVALGGYGRMEMAPHSDVDILYLHNGVPDAKLSEIISSINTFFYDSGKEVGHTCRTIKESFRYLDDMSSYHAILDSRFLTGSRELFKKYQTDFLDKLPAKYATRYNEAKESQLSERFLREGRPILLSEPNLKTDICGLRDIQYVYWKEKSTSPIQSLGALAHLPVFKNGDVQALEEAYDFLVRTRIALHVISGRKNDRLDLNLQPEVAEYLGFGKKEELQTVEKFMNILYSHQKNVFFTIRLYLDSIIESRKSDRGHDLVYEGVRFNRIENTVFPPVEGNLFADPHTIYKDILLTFRMIQETGFRISGSLLSEIRFASHFLDDDFRYSAEVNGEFLNILRNPKDRGKILKLMHECQVLGALLPEFGACTNFPLFSYHHEFTVDEHTLLILYELDRLDKNEFEDKDIAQVYEECTKTEILALAILLHDAGKVKEGDHSEYGAELAVSVGSRLGLSEEDTDLFRFLVEKHILMSELSSKRDISDKVLIRNFARTVANAERLKLLYVLTIIDTKSVGSNVLTNWKKAILNELYKNAIDAFRNKKPDDEYAHGEEERLALCKDLVAYLTEKEGQDAKIAKSIASFAYSVIPASFLKTVSNRKILKHFKAIAILSQEEGNDLLFDSEQDPAFVTVEVVSRNIPEILLDLCCSVSSEGLSLVGMQSYAHGEFHIHILQITDSQGSGNIPAEKISRMEGKLRLMASGELQRDKIAFERTEWNPRKTIPESIVNRSVRFSNEDLTDTTIMEVRMPDMVGLVYRILRKVFDFGLKVSYLRVSTSADYAYDSFYLQTAEGEQVKDPELLRSLEARILRIQPVERMTGELVF
ncbi:HD domain-containing protein [Leptospira langatensis]|uniref:Bifunctional uridylyltransferase/uridylyl-removing enzyme n=1 Tax=Leptospira langatensis TaxID=2484983 RepID=A0A5F1ZQQ5_9LEPT|nr:HD domain-containing protein [Leptospira langatensis]TGK02791.1 HD domain-containing protein [Leptospira langatensis]TGL40004.1 HD domain-containing protein [Leptospira langatensis]